MTTPPPPSAPEGPASGADGPEPSASAPATPGKAAELMAAVRAVESGERSATDFFAQPSPPSSPARPHPPQPVATSATQTGPVSVEVPAEVHEVLARGGAPAALASPVVAALGPQAAEVLSADPWQLLAVSGVRPEQADAFARASLGAECEPGDPRRGQALAVWLLTRAAQLGHTALQVDTLAQQLTAHAVPDADAVLGGAVDEGLVLAFAPERPDAQPEADEPAETQAPEEAPTGPVLLGLERWALAEESLAEGVQRLLSTFTPGQPEREEWAKSAAAAASPSASELIQAAALSAVVLHTGGETAKAEPAALASAAAALGVRVCLVAHTEDGRARLATALASHDAPVAETAAPCVVTVPGLLGGVEGPERDEEGCFTVDLLIVTDATQLDTEAAAALVESLPDGARLVLSGDPQLLGSAGAGQVLVDLLAARVCPHVVSRTPDLGPLGELVSSVGVGELPQVDAPDRELVIVPVRDAGEAVHRTVQLVADSVPRAVGVPAEETQVITVGREGGAGAHALNAALKQRLNPGPGAFDGFDAGDRVLHARAPGQSVPGHVVGADEAGLRLECAGQHVTVPRELIAETVRHGWAMTAHQAAGRRWPAVVVVLPGDAGPRLDRRWVYTAFGRGERHVSVVHGLGGELDRVVAERPGTPRATRLTTLLAPQQPA